MMGSPSLDSLFRPIFGSYAGANAVRRDSVESGGGKWLFERLMHYRAPHSIRRSGRLVDETECSVGAHTGGRREPIQAWTFVDGWFLQDHLDPKPLTRVKCQMSGSMHPRRKSRSIAHLVCRFS